MSAYYNENDPKAAAWLRELIKGGRIANGEVDERSIVDVEPDDLLGFRQFHFFAGIGGWSLALRIAGWPDDREVWTGSCPCQGFSTAGKGKGGADDRHLWPDWFRLIRECKPPSLFGEQVSAAIGHGWLDLVCTDLEREGYACGSAVLGAHSIGAPHIRQRLYWVAHTDLAGLEGRGAVRQRADQCAAGQDSVAGRVGDTAHKRIDGGRDAGARRGAEPPESGATCGVGNADSAGRKAWDFQSIGTATRPEQSARAGSHGGTGEDHGGWSDIDWLFCRDEKWRPVEPGTFPLAHGVPARVGRLRGYGNAIVPAVAAAFVSAAA